MNKYLLIAPLAAMLAVTGCSNDATHADNNQQLLELDSTESGLKYKIYTKQKGEKLDTGDFVYVSYRGHLDSAGFDGAKFDASYDRNQPIIYRLLIDQLIQGWQEGVPMLTVGDSATLVIPPDLGYGDRQQRAIPANSTLRFHIKIEDKDDSQLGMPFSIGKKDTIVDESGIKYAFIRKTDWASPSQGSNVAMHYRGYFLDGEIFDESITKGQPFTFKLGTGGVIKGWDIIAAKMNVGDKVRVVIPSDLAYGDSDNGPIPGGSTLVFDIVMIGSF